MKAAVMGVVSCLAIAICATAGAPAAPATSPHVKHELATCFWEGPISMKRPSTRGFDGRYFNFPEESATYWMSRFSLPPGARLVLEGRYPHARYISLNSYSDAAPTDTLSDIAIKPDPGATNPFVAGHRRDRHRRGWHVTVLDQLPPAERQPNTLYARPEASDVGAAIEVFYRVYEPDRGRNRFLGGGGLPRPVLHRADGSVARGEDACAAINDQNREITVDTTPEAEWEAGRAAPPCDAETNPAYDPPRWERLFTYEFAALSVVTDCTDEGRAARQAQTPEVKGANYSNRDSAYVYTHLAEEFGPVFVVQAKLPRTPTTRDGRERMGRGQLRFWSLCTNESRVTAFSRDCYAGRQVPIDRDRNFTIAISKPEDRPANARKRCGYGWLAWPERGDGVGDTGYALLILRNMLADPRFPHAIQRVSAAGTEAEVMGPYFPRSSYTTVEGFEARGC
jgi:hypothetical protein